MHAIKTAADIIRQRNAALRALYAFTRADKRLRAAADLCQRLNWQDGHASMILVRESVFGEEFRGVPLCPLEDATAFRHPNSLALILGYEAFKHSIGEQLIEGQKALRARERAAANVQREAVTNG